mmetsp:Transcript_66717/g.134488  ORF Transcript_66717/g.134488 Transcript_66717/m.134488 type:complete len:232 (+) Transcript_66717:48-743(+)
MYNSIQTPQPQSPFVNRDKCVSQCWKVCRLVGGGGVTASRAIKIVGNLSNLDMDASHEILILLDLWVLIFGLIMVLVEDFRFSGDFRRGLTRRRLYYYFRFLFIPPGRGYYYLLVASLLLVRSMESTADMVLGGYVAFLAVVSVLVGHVAAHKLHKLKFAFASEATIKQHFQAQLLETPDELSPQELQRFCEGVGVSLGPIALDDAIGLIDNDQSGSVSLSEFIDWWRRDL